MGKSAYLGEAVVLVARGSALGRIQWLARYSFQNFEKVGLAVFLASGQLMESLSEWPYSTERVPSTLVFEGSNPSEKIAFCAPLFYIFASL